MRDNAPPWMREHYVRHVLRMPLEEWPEPVIRAFKHTNKHIYVMTQGLSDTISRTT